jgi:hypothetical protein
MAEREREFSELRARAENRILDFLRSKPGHTCTAADVRAFCRFSSMSGLSESVLEWLEEKGAIRYQRDTETVYLISGGADVAGESQPSGTSKDEAGCGGDTP